jgi:hypothetical protein
VPRTKIRPFDTGPIPEYRVHISQGYHGLFSPTLEERGRRGLGGRREKSLQNFFFMVEFMQVLKIFQT